MPHAVPDQDDEDAQDDALIQQALDPHSQLDFNRDLEPGEKADDAVDFGDLSDDDLADDEGVHGDGIEEGISSSGPPGDIAQDDNLPSFDSSTAFDKFDDLFGDDASSSPEGGSLTLKAMHSVENSSQSSYVARGGQLEAQVSDSPAIARPLGALLSQVTSHIPDSRVQNVSNSKEQQLQQDLFALSKTGLTSAENLPEPPENHEELLAVLWPKFEREAIPRFMNLLPPKKAKYMGRWFPRPPKVVNPTKVNLELAQDQEKAFKVSSGPSKRSYETMEKSGTGTVHLDTFIDISSDEVVEMDSSEDNDSVYGISGQDFRILCESWETLSHAHSGWSETCESGRADAVSKIAIDDGNTNTEQDCGRPSAEVSTQQVVGEQNI